ncbi:MAG: integrase [Cyanobacteria bacterium]|nr:integrase [Cyanobacteriota bacterium]MDA0865616.1 integrase [Cyanobacteriota bacterium]
MEALLVQGRFDWQPYLKGTQRLPETVGDWVERYVANHWEHTPATPDKKATFRNDYVLHFEKLPQDAPLTVELLERVLLKHSAPATRSRKGYAMAYWKLAGFAGLPVETLKRLGQGYNAKQVNPRNLPSDEEIALAWEKITDPGWRWLFEAMAVYGLRPHEVFVARVEGLQNEVPVLEVPDETKTGWHIAFPMQMEDWPFTAMEPRLPTVKLEGLTNRQIGMKVAPRFKALQLGFVPYDLRHAYARRGYELGFPPEFLARSMGHSYAVHCNTYKAWIGQDTDLKIYQTIMRAKLSAHRGG